jgi:hypothetical protein
MAGNNARHTARYTTTQKDALLHAVLVNGHTGADAVRMAREGRLGIPAFEVDRHYVYTILRKGREGYEARNDDALEAAAEAELKANLQAAVAHNRALLAKLKRDGSDDPEALARSSQALSAVKRARRDTRERVKTRATASNTAGQSQTSDTEPVNTPGPASPLSSLLDLVPKATSQGARTGSLGGARIEPDAA